MVDKIDLLKKLPAFNNIKKVVKVDQGVGDIIKGIIRTHEEYKNDYDKISDYFLGNGVKDTAHNIWNFLKKNVAYYIESDNMQTLRSPAAIISLPADCKSYSLFSNGVLDSLRRKGKINCKLAFRFAGYDSTSDHLEHVFCVINPDTSNEIWCDPVLNSFNLKKYPSVYRDKKIEKMSLVGLSGISGNYDNKPAQFNGLPSSVTNLANSVTSTASALTDPISAVTTAVNLLASLFPGHSNWWLMDDAYKNGDFNNAANFFVKFYYDPSFNTANNGKAGFQGDLAVRERQLWIPNLYNATKRQDILQIWNDAVKQGILPNTGMPVMSASGQVKIDPVTGQPITTSSSYAGMNIYVTLALVGAGIYAVSKMSK